MKQDRFARVREVVSLLLDPMAVMLIIAAVVYFLLGETRDAVVLALAQIPVLGVDVVLEARSRAALEELARAAAPFADVVRDRHVVSVPLEEGRRHRRSRGANCLLGQSAAAEGGRPGPAPQYRRRHVEVSSSQSAAGAGCHRRRVLEAIQKRALEEGLPYQTLISGLLHKYAAGRLKEV